METTNRPQHDPSAGVSRTSAQPSPRVSTLPTGPTAWTFETVVASLGILDQAARGLLSVRQLQSMHELPRSTLLDAFRVYNQFKRGDARFLSQARLLTSAGSCMAHLAKEWKTILSEADSIRNTRREKAVRYYTLASLTAASLIIPWLLLRKRDEAPKRFTTLTARSS